MQVRADLLDDYRARHAAVWPEMLKALEAAGWTRYSLFARPDGMVIGYVEADDLEAAQAAMAETDANRRWQSEMSSFFELPDGRHPDEAMVVMEEIFNLEDQLAAHLAGGGS